MQPAPRTQPPASGSGPRGGAPLPEDWPQEPSEPADAPESNAWETAAVPEDIHVSSAVSDDEWASTNWAGATATRPGTASSAGPGTGSSMPGPGSTAPGGTDTAGSGRGTAPQPSAHGASAQQSAVHPAAGANTPGATSPSPNSNGASPAAAGSAPSGVTAYAGAPGSSGSAAPGTPQGAPDHAGQVQRQPAPGQKLSRYQQLLNEAAQRGGTAPSAAVRGNVDLAYVEDVPSADDVTLEDSGLVGRKAIERILGGRLIEERSLDGHGAHR